MKKDPITQKGYDLLCEELNNLKLVERPQTVIELDIARSHGDLKENSEYHAAKEKLAFIDTRISYLTSSTMNSQIVDPSSYEHDIVKFGSSVEVEDIDSEKKIVYTIVGEIQSNPSKNLISTNTPIAKKLLSKSEGDQFEITLPNGVKEYEIVKIYYKEFE